MFGEILSGATGIAGGILGMNAGRDAKADMSRYAEAYNPYIQQGQDATNYLLGQSQQLTQNPNFLQDMISQGFYTSPYQNQMIGDTTQQMNMNAANSGMIQSPMAQQALNDRIGTMTGQFLNDYINRGMQSYGMGLNNYSNVSNMGFNALNQKNNLLAGGTEIGANSTMGGINAMMNGIGGMAAGFGGPKK